MTLKELVARFERDVIARALELSGGNRREAARTLGLLPSTRNEKMKRLRLRRAQDTLEHSAAPEVKRANGT